MNTPDLLQAAAIGLVFLLAGGVKGLIGLGLPTIAMALLTLLLSPAQAAALLLLPSVVTNLVQMAPARASWALTRRFWPMLAGLFAGILLGGWLWGGFGGRYGAFVLGIVLALYGAVGLAAWRPLLPERWGLAAGLATGGLTSATGIFVIPAVPWLQAQGLGKDELVRALGVTFTVATLGLGLLLGGAGELRAGLLGQSLLALIPALIGQSIGARLRGAMPEAVFRRVFFVSLVALGAAIALKG
ncbi:sulfite exporter TauE/SafE family protein [Roseococcus sp. SYP-B2431]|uniref:sulfite exporter TauE/SafE family protein n=1 Tax=Roseococcus sp. SYP-B2431 TaxID=2496640 RepID=UPI00103A4FAA|nr:sulfite exporter TauE/SafE family protein [Roseococcus sp. SYP-B2431]TCH99758.1 sulfite exporter TauE/SafE family protein [Roseococcus sp. SYP-B2431]